MKSITDLARKENRNLTPSECEAFDMAEAIYDSRSAGVETRGGGGGDDAAYRAAFSNYLRYGETSPELRTNPLSTAPGAPAAGSALAGEGGYFVPQGLWHNLQIALKAYGGIASQFKQVETETGNPMPWPTHDPTAIVGSLLSENTQVSEVDFTIGQGMLSAWTVTSGVHLVSIQVAEDSAFDIDSFIADRVGESIGRKQAALAVSGSGSSQQLGVITAITAYGAYGGAGTSGGYVNLTAAAQVDTFSHPTGTTELTAGVPSPQTLINVISAVDSAYLPNSKWYMPAAMAWGLRGVVDANGRPILNFANGFSADDQTSPNYSDNSPVAMLLGFPVIIDNNLGGLTASTVSAPLFGDLSRAMVQRTVGPGVRVLRLTERYADYLQVGYIGFMRTDMRSNDLRAVACVKAAST
jgi:HK97 family phage major capsid protein